jgi:ABC-2 type transport system ATP-binding protein
VTTGSIPGIGAEGSARPTAAILVDDLRVRRGGRLVLDDLSLWIDRGRVTGLLGPNGAGKTTLIRCIVGVQVVEAGRVSVLGEPAGSAGLRARVGYLTQAPAVYLDLRVSENLAFFARLLSVPHDRIDAAVRTAGLQRLERRLVGSMSGGQRARVSLATALLGDPDVLILDEPTVGLDPVLRRDLWETFHALAAEGRTVVVSSHVMDEAGRCDRLVLLRDGRLVASLTPAELRERTGRDDLEEAFLQLAERPER